MNKDVLYLRRANYKEIKHACLNYHYAKSIPVGIYYALSVFENRQFIGIIMFSRGANRNLSKSFNLEQNQCCELTRVALKYHKTAVSHLLKISISMLKKDNPNLKVIVSYADSEQGHTGQIYKASNWIYTNEVVNFSFYNIKTNKKIHMRSINSQYGLCKNALATGIYKKVKNKPKYKFIYFLDKKFKREYMRILESKN